MSIVNKVTAGIMVLNALAIGYVLYLMFYPFHVIDVIPQPYVINETDVHPGQYISYTFHYCKNYDVTANIIHQLSGATEIAVEAPLPTLNDATIRLLDNCGTTTKAVYIPRHTPPGEYELYEYVDYQVNPLQKVSYIFKTEPFNVHID